MNADQLLSALGDIDESYILDAERQKSFLPRLRRAALMAASLILIFTLAAASLAAADVDAAYDLIYRLYPTAAQRLKPVRLSAEDQGIRVEVVSARLEGESAQICVALKDVEGERLDKTVDLFDSYDIRSPYDSSAHCERLSWDEDTQTAYFYIEIDLMDGQWPREGKVTFRVDELLLGKEEWEGPISTAPLARLAEEATALPIPQGRERGGSEREGYEREARAARLALAADTEPLELAEGVQLTAMGFVNGRLHVQTHYDDISHTDNHGYVYLTRGGEPIQDIYSFDFWDADPRDPNRGSFQEQVFAVSPGDAADYTLSGYFCTCDQLLQGDWEITFPVE